MKVVRFIAGMRYFVLIPVIGLAIAACTLFIIGGADLVRFMVGLVTGMGEAGPEADIIVEIVEAVHLFLVGTVLFLTSIGFYQLFIKPVPLPGWLEINDVEELELNLVGLTIVVLGVNFLSVIESQETDLAVYGIGYALPIIALAYFMKVRSQMSKQKREETDAALKESASDNSDTSRLTNKRD
ncbi:MAG: YqhA family protein [Methanosarcina sp.]